MTLGTDDGKTSRLLDFGRKLDVGTTTGHVGGYGDGAFLTGLCHDFGLSLVQLGIEHIVGDAAQCEHSREQLRYFDRGCTHEHRAALLDEVDDLIDYGGILFLLGLVDAVVHVNTCHRLVGGYCHDIELVYVPELACFGFGRTGHTCKLVIHTEVVLEGDCGECLCRSLDFHALLGLDGLMESVGVAAAFHDTACLLVDNLDFVVVDYVFHILFKEGVGLEQLGHGVYALGFHRVVLHQLVLALLAFGC